jgi:hypothetical protein
MNAAETLDALRAAGVRVRLADGGENVKYSPASTTPPELVEAIRSNKPEVKRLLGGGVVSSPAELLEMAREFFGWPAEDREPPIPKAPKGRDPFVYGRKRRDG